ncbi:hypothetical protein [Pseudonocardia xishanensis]|uniref:Transcription factor zinc-finger domain-containing protein n=1 Tax=Pseudonocardia xishanensis TaxID=630995 RepID=A0ABP8S2L4_9PSEU
MGDSAWWSCPECGSYAELSAEETVGFTVECPDCRGSMVSQWVWEETSTAA